MASIWGAVCQHQMKPRYHVAMLELQINFVFDMQIRKLNKLIHMSLQILGGASELLETLFRDTTLELSWTVQTLFWIIGVYNGCASFLGLLIPDTIQEELTRGTHRFNSSTYLWSVAQVKPFASMGTWVWLCGVPGVVGLMLWWLWCYPQYHGIKFPDAPWHGRGP